MSLAKASASLINYQHKQTHVTHSALSAFLLASLSSFLIDRVCLRSPRATASRRDTLRLPRHLHHLRLVLDQVRQWAPLQRAQSRCPAAGAPPRCAASAPDVPSTRTIRTARRWAARSTPGPTRGTSRCGTRARLPQSARYQLTRIYSELTLSPSSASTDFTYTSPHAYPIHLPARAACTLP